MESLTSVYPSLILPPTTTTTIPVSTSRSLLVRLRPYRASSLSVLSISGRRNSISRRTNLISCKSTGAGGGSDKVDDDEDESEELEKALHLDGTIPGTSDEFVRKVSSRAYEIPPAMTVFEDMNEAVRYCYLLQGGGKGYEGVAEIEASSVFDLCRK